MTYPIGLDISKYNVVRDGDLPSSRLLSTWDPSKATRPIDFVVQRVTGVYTNSGGLYIDREIDYLYQMIQSIPVRGAYHFFAPKANWKTQADFFLSHVTGKNYHFYVLDYERYGNVLDGTSIAMAAEFVKYVKAQTGKKCIFYCNSDTLATNVYFYGYMNWFNSQDTWIAQYPYTKTSEITATQPSLLPSVSNAKWNLWQYGGGDVGNTAGAYAGEYYGSPLRLDKNGYEGIDLNYFNGTVEDLYGFFNVKDSIEVSPVQPPIVTEPTEPEPEIPSEDILEISRIAVSSLNVRKEPSATSEKVGGLQYDDIAEILEFRKIGSNIWGRIALGWIAMFYNGYYYTTTKSFDSFFVEPAPEPEIVVPVPEESVLEKITTKFSMNVRYEPSTMSQIVGNIPYGGTVELLEIKKFSDTNIWGRCSIGWFALYYGGTYFTNKSSFEEDYTTEPIPTEPDILEPSNLYTFSPITFWQRPGNGPLVEPCFIVTSGKAGSKEIVIKDSQWFKYLENTNSERAYERIISTDWGPTKGFTDAPANTKLRWNTLVYPGRNIVQLTGKTQYVNNGDNSGIYGEVVALDITKGLPGPEVNYVDTPHLVHDLYCGTGSSYFLANPQAYVPILQEGESRWYNLKNLISVDSQLPKSIVLNKSGMNIRAIPSINGDVVATKAFGATVVVRAVRIGKGGIWGKTDEGWIALRYQHKTMTSWSI